MLIKTRGIILRSIKYSETSVITDIFTEEKGLRTYIISGVRSQKAKFNVSLLQVMSLVDIVAYHREDKEMTRIKELKPAHIFQSLPFDIYKSSVGMMMIEVAQKSIREKEENDRLFQFLFEYFQFLDETKESVANIHLHFILQLSAYLGFRPGGDYSASTPIFDLEEGLFVAESENHVNYLEEHQSFLLYQLLQCDKTESHLILMTRQDRGNLLEELINFYRLHIENFPIINSLAVLKEVME
jgi:DNA repair protein RecO (recombination protein O)